MNSQQESRTPEQREALAHVDDALTLMPPRGTTAAVFQADPDMAANWLGALRDVLEEVRAAFTGGGQP